jgi:hypothetical protein
MAAPQSSDLYLIRKDRSWVKYSDISQIDVTGAQLVYSDVTGVASTNVITIAGNILQNDYPVYFQGIVGGAGLTTNTTYWVINASGNTFKLSLTKGGSAIDFTTDITGGTLIYSNNEIYVWSPAYRDIFSGLGTQQGTAGGTEKPGGGTYGAVPLGAPQGVGISLDPSQPTSYFTQTPPLGQETTYLTGTVKIMASDDVNHFPLRQTALKRTYWRFKQLTNAPTYLFAEILEGDKIADNPPETA